MSDLIQLTGLTAQIALLLPFAGAAALTALALVADPSPSAEAPTDADDARDQSATVDANSLCTPEKNCVSSVAPVLMARMVDLDQVQPTGDALERAEEPPRPVVLDDQIADARSSGDHVRLAPLYFEMGIGAIEQGRTADAAGALRSCILAAQAARNIDLHARARIELAELARIEGDLTTACEHWQIARALYSDVKNKDAQVSTETRMRRHGCPTDWILTHF